MISACYMFVSILATTWNIAPAWSAGPVVSIGSLFHITCLALTNNLAILRYPDELVSVTLTDSVSRFSREVLKKNWLSRCRACYDRIITPSFSLDDPVMFLYDNGIDERSKNMDGFAGGNFAANQCRNLLAHPTSLAPSTTYTSGEVPASGIGEPVKQCSPCSATQSSPNASLPYGYFGNGYYPCRMSHGSVKTCAQPSGYGDKYMDTSISGEEFPSRAKEYAFYQGYSSGPYQASYLDVPVVPALSAPSELRHNEALLHMEPYQPWALANSWNGQVYCTKDQPSSNAIWKSSLQGIVH